MRGRTPPGTIVPPETRENELEASKLKAQHAREIDQLHTQLNRMERVLEKKETKHSESRDSAAALRKQLAKTVKEVEIKDQMINRLRDQFAEDENRLVEARGQIRKLEDRVKDMGSKDK